MRKVSWVVFTALSLVSLESMANEATRASLNIRGDFLYMRVKQHGLDYTTKPKSVFSTTDFTKSHLVSPSFDWRAGFRVAADYAFFDSRWSVGLHATQFNGFAHGKKNAECDEGIFPALSFADDTLPTDYVTSAHEHWHLNATLLDVLSFYHWPICSRFTLTPTLGARNAWINQHISASYGGAMFSAGHDHAKLRSSFYGIGPRIGIRPRVILGNGFSLYGDATGSMLFGWFVVHQKETFLSGERDSEHKSPDGIRWNADLTAGITWTHCFESSSWIKGFLIDLGFDYLYFSKQYPFEHGSQFSLHDQSKSLITYGIHLAAGFQF